ncbi:MAG: L-lactate dehydrogenase complex protein LldG, partial [Chloroflexota bacterium]|nr:L-lactate dehydrogenase complex protein LldG [Chloroflexota bacterium]
MTDRPVPGAREAILERIRAALVDRPGPVSIPRAYETVLSSTIDRIALFVDRVDDYRATIERTTAANLPSVIAATLGANGAHRIAVPAGVPAAWLAGSSVERVADEPPLTHAQLDALDGSISGCA